MKPSDREMKDGCCRICKNIDGNVPYLVRELMFGTGDEFTYFQCGRCGCLQILEVPENLSSYYPSDYYSYRDYSRLARKKVKRILDTKRMVYYRTGRSIIGRLASFRSKPPNYYAWVKQGGITPDSRILDVGSGSGKLLVKMSLAGFRHCTGLDQYIPRTVEYPGGVRILKQDLFGFAKDAEVKFDLIMFHHSFEHMPDPAGILKTAAELLHPEGTLFLHIPLSDSHAWEVYREKWVQLDAPRHLFLHTRKSMELLAQEAGLHIDKVIYDSSEFQFVGSELYRRGLPMVSAQTRETSFSKKELQNFQIQARDLNRSGKGDQARFFLVRKVCR